MPPRFKRKRRGPLFVFVTSATIAGLLGHAALLSSLQRHGGAEWKAPTAPELVREASNDPERLALNAER